MPLAPDANGMPAGKEQFAIVTDPVTFTIRNVLFEAAWTKVLHIPNLR